MERASNPVRRCAVYTRKSSEEGLEQDFNSLHAQREACEAFIKSQQGEGWRLVRANYDDGGISGGTMERPALQRLLDDIRSGAIDVVVVYKVDRLTRSLADFAKMVEVFDARQVSFVAVTQQFNTTTSMGRLTLNVLLSFAQFEREVTGERIRDKIAASKRKGIWMGGYPPLGYDVRERHLIINHREAAVVKQIYERFLELGSVRRLKNELDHKGVVSKLRVSRKGIATGGKSFSRGALYELLANPIYIGEIRHKQERHPGQHEPILARELWESVQRRIRDSAARKQKPPTKASSSWLAGKVFDATGEPLYAQGALNHGRRYRYFVSRALVRGSSNEAQRRWRVPAQELERAIETAAAVILDDKQAVLEVGEKDEVDVVQVLNSAAQWSDRLRTETDKGNVLKDLIEKVILSGDGVRLGLHLPTVENGSGGTLIRKKLELDRFIPIRIKRHGAEMRLIVSGGVAPRAVDPALLKAVARARQWFEQLSSGSDRSLAEIARREKLSRRYVSDFIRMAFLSPYVIEAIADGDSGIAINLQMFKDGRVDLPLGWGDKRDLSIEEADPRREIRKHSKIALRN